jgi:oligopeptide/dipeptide ABC transporter ATP-binding protein
VDERNILEIRNLKVHFAMDTGVLKAVDGVDITLKPGQILGIIGESGCGKSVTSQAIMGIVPDPGKVVDGSIQLRTKEGGTVDIAKLGPDSETMRSIRGSQISIIFQEPMTSLSPVHTIGRQIDEMVLLHRTADRREARTITLEMLHKVGITNAEQRYHEFPHQLSGGIRQRAMIAMALSCQPRILIADEPTTALDVTVQAQILELMNKILRESSMSVLYITHDLGVISEIADDVVVMYLGRVVEEAPKLRLFKHPLHPYTVRLLRSIPRLTDTGDRLAVIPGTVPLPVDLEPQCGFCERCDEATDSRCAVCSPGLVEAEPGHFVRCFKYGATAEERS